jgi:serine protease Do
MTDKNTSSTSPVVSDQPSNTHLIPTVPPPRPPQKTGNVFLVFAAVFALLATSGLTAGITAWLVRADLNNTREITLSEQPVSAGEAVVQKVADSVVSITTESERYDWFGRRAVSSGAGSGVIVSRDGYILTNNHVVDGADTVLVATTNDEEYSARVVATEANSDLAVVKIIDEVDDLTPAELGNSSEVQVGADVYAIGNALGQYPNSVTKGIISGLGRPIVTSDSGLRGNLQEFEDLIQTDAAINSGNSGGPLVNAAGQVIGINTAVAGQAQNIGFSVPINRANDLIERAQTE